MKLYWALHLADKKIELQSGSPIAFIRWLSKTNLAHAASDNWIADLLALRHPIGTTTFIQHLHGKPIWALTWSEHEFGILPDSMLH